MKGLFVKYPNTIIVSPMATRSVLFSSSFLLILLSFSLEKSNALEGRKTIESNFHTIQLTSILPSSSCKPSSKGKLIKSPFYILKTICI